MIFSQRQHAMLARPAENGQLQPVKSNNVFLLLTLRLLFDSYINLLCNHNESSAQHKFL